MATIDIPPHVREALERRIEDQHRDRERRRSADLNAERQRTRESERLRPLTTMILSWAAALAESVTLPENGLRIPANIRSARARAGVIVRRDGGVTSYYVYPPYGGSSHDLGAALWPADIEVIEGMAAAITSGEIWERVLRGLS